MNQSHVGFGVVGSLDLKTVRRIAISIESLGYHSMWFNETPEGDAIERMAVAASATKTLVVGSGVINLDARSPERIIREFRDRSLPVDRVILGVGASSKPSPLTTVERGVTLLRAELGVPIIVGSLGPRMRQLGAEKANGLLFNWLTPDHAAATTAQMRVNAELANNPGVVAATYVRTALGVAARPVLEREAAKYSSFPTYAANFRRLDISALESAVQGNDADSIQAGLNAFDGTVDHVIVRAITADDRFESYQALIDAAAPS